MENNGNSGLVDLFDDLMSGRKTVDQIKEELHGATTYLRAGRNYRALKFDGFAKINGEAVTVYAASDKVDSFGVKVAAKPRAPKGTTPKRK